MKAFTLITISFFFNLACTGGPRKPIATNGKNVKFEWDFSREKKFVYTFHQTVNNEMVHTKGGAVDKMHMTGDGFLTVKVKANKLADVILSDILLKSINYDQDGKPTKEDEMECKIIKFKTRTYYITEEDNYAYDIDGDFCGILEDDNTVDNQIINHGAGGCTPNVATGGCLD